MPKKETQPTAEEAVTRPDDELSDEDLDSVAGGIVTLPSRGFWAPTEMAFDDVEVEAKALGRERKAELEQGK